MSVDSEQLVEPDQPGDPDQKPADPEAVARAICLRLLTQRARSRSELAEALLRRGVPAEAAGRVLDRFTEVGLIDDAALASMMAGAAHRERGLARRAVALTLRRRGLDEELVADAVASIGAEDERQRAQALVERRQRSLAALPVDVQQRRLVALLARKGYSPGMSYAVVRDALRGVDGSADVDNAAEPLDL